MKLEKQNAHLKSKKGEELEIQKFQDYANSFIQEWNQDGKNVSLLVKSIEKMIPKRKKEELRLNTFSRLGFS